jgi:hypothetical protein
MSFQLFHRYRYSVPNLVNSLSPVSLTLAISPRIFVKIQNDSNGILKGPGETDS